MDADHRELVHHLFALATEIAEAAHEIAVSGQVPASPDGDLDRLAATLDRHAGELQAIASAIAVIIGIDGAETSADEPF